MEFMSSTPGGHTKKHFPCHVGLLSDVFKGECQLR